MRKTAIILIIVGIVVVVAANLFIDQQTQAPLPVVKDDGTLRLTSEGEVVGFRDRHGARAWLGIPYAAPPVDEYRWRAPRPPESRSDVFEALSIGQMCPQFSSLLSDTGDGVTPGAIVGSEDCLYLNIWSPPNAARLPVMFWIHGGSNTAGHGGSYNGAALATNREVVVVTINYRLGFFGWFSHPGMNTGDPLDDSGNYGTVDTIQALKWVKENIGAFGGDPNNITVFGESAGGYDTLALMASPLSRGLFQKAIVQSGGYNPADLATAQQFEDDGGHSGSSAEIISGLLMRDGTVDSSAAAKAYLAGMSSTRLQEYLRNRPMQDYFAQFEAAGMSGVDVPTLIRDGHVLPDLSPKEIFSNADNHHVVPIILGTNRDEPSIWMAQNPDFVTNWLGFLPRIKDEATYTRYVKYGALSWKARGVDSLADYMLEAGNTNVYAYRFDWDEEPSQYGFDLSTALGAGHGLEIPFVFGEFEAGLPLNYIYPDDENQWALSNSMTSYWSMFAYQGDPAQGRDDSETAWLPWGTGGKYSLILDTPADQGIFMNTEKVTLEGIKETLALDQGFSNPVDQCTVYARNFRDSDFNEQEYAALNSECANIDPQTLQF